MQKSYTYLIGWSKYNKWYYGVRWANKYLPKEDLWIKYFTSSKYVKEFYKTHGDPDVIQVRKVFDNFEEAQNWEYKVLKRCNIINEDKWLNKNISGTWDHNDIEIRKKISASNTGKIFSKESKKKMSQKAKRRCERDGAPKDGFKKEHGPWNKGKVGLQTNPYKGIKGRYSENELKSISEGTKNGMAKMSAECKKEIYKKRDSCQGRIWINNGNKNKRILPETLNEYIDKGWIKGRCK